MLLPFVFLLLVVVVFLVLVVVDDEMVSQWLSQSSSEERQLQSPTVIPRTVIQLTNAAPTTTSSLRAKNPTYKFITMNDDQIHLFLELHYPQYLATYARLPAMIMRIDFFRYLAVYHHGGFYMDSDVEAVRPFDDTLCQHGAVFPIDTYLTDSQCDLQTNGYNARFSEFCRSDATKPEVPYLLGQYAFGARRRHPFLKALVDAIHRNAEVHNKSADFVDNNFVYKATGPDFVTRVWKDNSSFLSGPQAGVFVLKKNPPTSLFEKFLDLFGGTRDRSLTNPYRYFGNYAVHLNHGSWKKKEKR